MTDILNNIHQVRSQWKDWKVESKK